MKLTRAEANCLANIFPESFAVYKRLVSKQEAFLRYGSFFSSSRTWIRDEKQVSKGVLKSLFIDCAPILLGVNASMIG